VDEFGPAAGIAAALEHSSARWNLIVACDMPRVTASLFELLLETAESGAADAVVPVQPDGYEQPLCAVYSSALRDAFRAAIERGEGKILRVLAGAKVRYLQPPEYARVGKGESLFANLNTPADFAELG
jgi:molybdopterin-guanine dinucleotide biosynthesis protein A